MGCENCKRVEGHDDWCVEQRIEELAEQGRLCYERGVEIQRLRAALTEITKLWVTDDKGRFGPVVSAEAITIAERALADDDLFLKINLEDFK